MKIPLTILCLLPILASSQPDYVIKSITFEDSYKQLINQNLEDLGWTYRSTTAYKGQSGKNINIYYRKDEVEDSITFRYQSGSNRHQIIMTGMETGNLEYLETDPPFDSFSWQNSFALETQDTTTGSETVMILGHPGYFPEYTADPFLPLHVYPDGRIKNNPAFTASPFVVPIVNALPWAIFLFAIGLCLAAVKKSIKRHGPSRSRKGKKSAKKPAKKK
jgi:hypothetical protein